MNTSKRHSIASGTLFTVAMRWSDRLIGFASLLILARLLSPDDIGLIAMATLVIGLTDVLLDLGVNVALVRDRDATQAHFNTAWTLRLIQSALVTMLIIGAASWAADYFGDPRITPVLRVLAFSVMLAGLENIGVVALHKNMQFGAEFRFLITRRLFGFLLTLAAAWMLRSYWALVIGTLGSRAFGALLSYRAHPMRPRLDLSQFRAIFAVSQWMLLRGIGEFLHNNLHRILVGRWSSTSTMGAYTLANELSTMPSAELVAPMNRALFPAMADNRDQPESLTRLFLLALQLQTLIALPATVGLALVAGEAVPVLLGSKWQESVPLLQWLALAGIAQVLTSSGHYVLIVLGRVGQSVAILWLQVAVFGAAVWLALPLDNAGTVAALRVAVTVLGIAATAALLVAALAPLTLSALSGAIVRPIVATLLMTAALIELGNHLPFAPATVLIVKVASGVLVYAASVIALWRLAGRPNGAETWLFDKYRTWQEGKRAMTNDT